MNPGPAPRVHCPIIIIKISCSARSYYALHRFRISFTRIGKYLSANCLQSSSVLCDEVEAQPSTYGYCLLTVYNRLELPVLDHVQHSVIED